MVSASFKKLEYEKVRTKLVELCNSYIAKEEAHDLEPVVDKKIITRRLQETNEARDMLRLYPTFSLGGLRDIRSALQRVNKGGTLEPQDFLEILDSIQSAARVKTFFSNVKGDFTNFRDAAADIHLFKTLERRINECISNDGLINDNATNALFQVRRSLRQNQDQVKAKLDSLIRNVNFQKFLQDNIITIRDGRYVVPVKQEYRAQVPGLVHDQSASGATLFIEPMALVEINNTIRRLSVQEEQEIVKILTELSQEVAERYEELLQTTFVMARMDFMLAKGMLSAKMDGVCPIISNERYLNIKKGRHPLIEGKAVPIDVNLGKKFDMLVITGPNTGGKTVTLKTVGLFTLMFMSGLHVPAEDGTELYPFNKIFADIGDEQSIEQSLSTFSSHMKNIIDILQNSDEETLVLLDELGAGTDPTEGAAIGMAILDTLDQSKSKVIATTHYSELKAYAYANSRVENASVEFNLETLMPTYKLAIGIPGSSNAFEIAKRLGLPGTVVEKAQSFLTQEDIKVADLIKNLEENERKLKDERQQILLELKEAKAKHILAEEKLVNIEHETAEKIQRAYKEALDIVDETKEQANKVYKDLHTTLVQESRKAQNSALAEAKKKLEEQKTLIKEKIVTAPKLKANIKVKKGDTVFVKKLNLKAVVVEEPDLKGEVTVQAGIIKVTVPLTELEHAEEQKTILKSNMGYLSKSKKTSIANSIDLRGKTAFEAIEEIDKYIDDAVVAGLEVINIIHGKGTGVLRKSIGDYLKGDSRIKSIRIGDFNEGGTGVTVVTLKT